MKHVLIRAALPFALLSVVAGLAPAAAPAKAPGEPPKTTGKVTIEDLTDLPKGSRMPARLSPDGTQVLYISRDPGQRQYTYYLFDPATKKRTTFYQSKLKDDGMLAFTFGRGMWSPNGEKVTVMTADDPKGRNPRMVIYDVAGKKETLLPTQHTSVLGAVFATDDTIYFADCGSLKREESRCTIRKYDVKTNKSSDVADYPSAVVVCLTLSPDRSRLGGVLVRRRGPDRGAPEVRLWAHDIDTNKTVESAAIKIEGYLSDVVWAFWDADGRALYVNGKLDPKAKGKENFSILRFAPFAIAGAKLSVLQQRKTMLTTGAFAPGKLSVTDRQERRRGAKVGVLDIRTDTVRELDQPGMLLDRRGRTGLFLNVVTEKLAIGRIVLK
jgi:dipeptidyl aminopeptidase/acylaminoacyl peptidase